ncbi:PTS sugar transporter subunit IIC [Lacticigenium naphthae]|uniref:PTS sugar transporter subunit IIC n=1 Tax=Lacticigenium naphthae TaxID=515351 RepID=UPI000414B81F|nr:PTS transporter subunit EIIC [Lacticigenium naphthae]
MKEKLKKFMEAFVNIAIKIGNQVHLRSIRDAFATIIPLFILAGLAVLVNWAVLPWFLSEDALVTAQRFGTSITRGTLDIAGLLLAPTIAYFLAKNKKFDNPISVAVISLATFIAMMPLQLMGTSTAGVEVELDGYLSFSNLGTQSMFAGIIIGLLAAEVLLKFNKIEAIKINLGEQVPSAVAKSFNVLLPAIFTISLFAGVSLFLSLVFGMDLISLIVNLIQEPLRKIGTSLGGYLLLYSLGNLLFSFGIHQSVINGPFTEPFMTQNINENMTAFNEGLEVPHILTLSFQTAFAQMGGTGSTISLIIAVFIFSKISAYKEIAKLSLAPGIFEINEPIIFGLPIVFNLPMMIPFVLLPIIQTLIAYAATAAGLISRTVVYIPWVTPPVISGWLATGGDWRASVLQIILITLGVLVYLPFLKISEQVLVRQAELENK